MRVCSVNQQLHSIKGLSFPQGRKEHSKIRTSASMSVDTTGELPLVGPEPKRFAPERGSLLGLTGASFQGLMRAGCGGFCHGYKATFATAEDSNKYSVLQVAKRALYETSDVASYPKPAQPLELYDLEGCPFCRKVREALCILDIDAIFYSCPRNGPNYRKRLLELGGKTMVPFLVDKNAGVQMYESDAIIAYLYKTYGPGEQHIPLALKLGFFTTVSVALALLPRALKGGRYRKSALNHGGNLKPLVYWGYELSPFCKLVKEELCELELPHLQKSMARGSPRRQEMFDKRGLFQVPFLEDPNQGVALFESAAILNYLKLTYGDPWREGDTTSIGA